jgi:hypothetical protein
MTWLVHLAAYPVHQLQLLGEPAQVAASSLAQTIHFYALEDGTEQATLELDIDLLDNDSEEQREAGLLALKAPNGAYLSCVAFGKTQLHLSADGQTRLIHDLNISLTLEKAPPGQPVTSYPLDLGKKGRPRAVAWEPKRGLIAALNKGGVLHIFEQEKALRQWACEYSSPLKLFVLAGGEQILLLNAQGLHLLDLDGRLIQHRALHYEAGAITLSPDQAHILVGDNDSQVLRLYDGDLQLLRQRHAMDFLLEARQTQLFAALPSPYAPISALSLDGAGNVVLALGGGVCNGQLDSMHRLAPTRAHL